VLVESKTQTLRSEHATFDRSGSKVVLAGNVAVGDGANVTRGDRLVYDLNTGVANMAPRAKGRVQALFVPGNATPAPQASAPRPQQRRAGTR